VATLSQSVTILVDSSQIWKSVSDKIGKLHNDLDFYEERHGCLLCFFSCSRATNPHQEMEKTFSPSYSSSQITYVEAVEFSRFRFYRKRTASTSLVKTECPSIYVPAS